MSDNIPFDIQIDIMNRLPVKSLLQFRTGSKQWKSCIDFINFQNTHGVCSSNDCCMILRYNQALKSYMLALDHNLTYSPLQSTLNDSTLLPIGTCHGIWCFSYALSIMATLWNPSIKRSINILVPAFTSQPQTEKILLGFGVHPDTLDPTIIKISYPRSGHGSWYVSVFTLSSMEWNKLKNDCLPRESIRFKRSSQAVVGQLLFWAGHESLGNSLILTGSTDETDCYLFCGWSLLVDVAFAKVDGVLAKNICLMNVLDDISLGDVTNVYRPKDIINDLNIDLNIDVLYKRPLKGKQLAVESNQGCPIASFAQLPYYCYNLKLANENTITHIEIDDEGRFKMLFIEFGVVVRI
ncbi:F-box domain containing protein [Tanacetum coccineum]